MVGCGAVALSKVEGGFLCDYAVRSSRFSGFFSTLRLFSPFMSTVRFQGFFAIFPVSLNLFFIVGAYSTIQCSIEVLSFR